MLDVVLALIGLGLTPPDAEAAPDDRFRLDWRAPEECGEAAMVEAKVHELLTPTLVSEAAPVEVAAEVQATGEGYRAELELRSGEHPVGRRILEDSSCSELVEGVALIIALAVEPDLFAPESDDEEAAVDEEPEIDDAETEDADIEASDSEEDAEPERAPVRERPRLGLSIAVTGGLGLATLPGITGRLGSELALHGRGWRTELGLDLWLPHTIGDARYQAWSGQLAGCGVPRFAPASVTIELPLCARVVLGAMQGVGLGPGGRRATAPWVAITPGLGLIALPRFARGRLGFVLRGEAVLPLTRPAFAFDSGSLRVRAGFGAQVLAGLELRFNFTAAPD